MTRLTEDSLAKIFRQMGEPSWWILSVLDPIDGKAGIAIIRAVEEALHRAGSPVKRLDPSTLHRAIARMEKLELVRRLPDELVEVHVGHGAIRLEPRPVWIITGDGQVVFSRWKLGVSAMLTPQTVELRL
jgi:hypothetical protein